MMSKWTLRLIVTVILSALLLSCGICAVCAEEEAEELQVNNEETTQSAETTAAASAVSATVPTTEPVVPADFPALTVNAISNFFPNASAEYSVTKKQVEVIYSMKCSKNLLSVKWYLSYDPKVFSLSEESNTAGRICPVVGDKAALEFYEGGVSYSASNVRLYDFSKREEPFVRLLFDVKELNPEQPEITKVDLTVDVLCVAETDETTKTADTESEIFLVSNETLSERGIDAVRLSRDTTLTPSNFVQATTAPPTTAAPATDASGNVIPASHDEPKETTVVPTAPTASADSTSATGSPLTAPTPSPTTPQKKSGEAEDAPVGTGEPLYAAICLVVVMAFTSVLFVLRKKEILY